MLITLSLVHAESATISPFTGEACRDIGQTEAVNMGPKIKERARERGIHIYIERGER